MKPDDIKQEIFERVKEKFITGADQVKVMEIVDITMKLIREDERAKLKKRLIKYARKLKITGKDSGDIEYDGFFIPRKIDDDITILDSLTTKS